MMPDLRFLHHLFDYESAWMEFFPYSEVIFIAAALLQFGLWSGVAIQRFSLDRKKYLAEIQLLRERIQDRHAQRLDEESLMHETRTSETEDESDQAWSGFRSFLISKMVPEAADCTSVYLQPEDGQPLPDYKPGQHITLQVNVNDSKLTRCYTLSDAGSPHEYRITVRRIKRPDGQAGAVSSHFHETLKVGDSLDVKPPSGSFYLEQGKRPIVMLAGGIGITPMIAIINHLIRERSNRTVVLVYGSGNGNEHAFKSHLDRVSSDHDNIHVINCYSRPRESDAPNQDYHVRGRVSIDVLKQVLPNSECEFYLCGPPAFMSDLHRGLADWGVIPDQIRYEAFGPATVQELKRKQPEHFDDNLGSKPAFPITFGKSGVLATWKPEFQNLLELAESNGIDIESGCRAGNCGSCETRVLSGSVNYDANLHVNCEPGWCLPCVAQPGESLELDA